MSVTNGQPRIVAAVSLTFNRQICLHPWRKRVNSPVPTACIVSIEVDGRQKYLFESDKLREMLGASVIMAATVKKAGDLFGASGLHLMQPVSGEIKAWAAIDLRDDLLRAAWQMRKWLEMRGVAHSAGYHECQHTHFVENGAIKSDPDEPGEPANPDLSWVHRAVGIPVGRQKAAKPGEDATPFCSFFAPCRMHGFDYANEWTTGGDTREPRRQQRSHRAATKYREWEAYKKTLYQDELSAPVVGRLQDVLGPEFEPDVWPPRAIQFRDLAEQIEEDEFAGRDQYLAFICADGDNVGTLLGHIHWNSPRWGEWGDPALGTIEPWDRNRRFVTALDRAVRESFRMALVQVSVPDDAKAAKDLQTDYKERGKYPLPTLPQLLGGDDFWAVARRDVALQLVTRFSIEFARHAADDLTLRSAVGIANLERARRNEAPLALTMSAGLAFAKAGHPAHAMIETAESLMSQAKRRRRHDQIAEGCLDWHWIQSSLSQSVDEARASGWRYRGYTANARGTRRDGVLLELTTRPWTITQADAFIAAANVFHAVSRRKREQLEDILRRGYKPSLLAWDAWWHSLSKDADGLDERDVMSKVAETLRGAGVTMSRDPRSQSRDKRFFQPWIRVEQDAYGTSLLDQPHFRTPLLDLLSLQDVLKPRDRPGTRMTSQD